MDCLCSWNWMTSDPHTLCIPTNFNKNISIHRFDFLVNGGGAIALNFQRHPFPPLTQTVFVPWNQVIYRIFQRCLLLWTFEQKN